MKKTILSLMSIMTIFIMMGSGKQASDGLGDKLHRINFYGRIITVGNQNKEIKINNISIDNLYKQIPVRLAPDSLTPNINPTTHIFKKSPERILPLVKIDPSEIKSVTVKRSEGNPVIWKWMDKDKVKREYIELIVTSNDNSKSNYLIHANKRLFYNEVSPAGPKETKLNFAGLMTLKIDGFTDRELEKRKKLEEKLRKRKKGLNHKYPKGIPTK